MAAGRPAEIVCADSRQLYAGMEIGTAAPCTEDLAAIPHHGFGTVPPEETYGAGRFIEDTDRRVREIQARGALLRWRRCGVR